MVRATLPCVLTLSLLAACTDASRGREEADASPPSSSAETSHPSASIAAAPSFDCAAAEGEVQTLICGSPELAALDRQLDSVWHLGLSAMRDGGAPASDVSLLRAEQRGWLGGRDDCWKEAPVADCVRREYRTRIATLQADFLLAPSDGPTFWVCGGNPASEFVATFVETEPRTVRVERGDEQESMVSVPAASGSRYTGWFGREAWFKGDEAMFIWPQTDTLTCQRR